MSREMDYMPPYNARITQAARKAWEVRYHNDFVVFLGCLRRILADMRNDGYRAGYKAGAKDSRRNIGCKVWFLEQKNSDGKLDKYADMVVKAHWEWEARQVASKSAQDERPETWLNEELSSCKELAPGGEPEFITGYAPGF